MDIVERSTSSRRENPADKNASSIDTSTLKVTDNILEKEFINKP